MCTYKDSARTSQRTHCTSIRKTNRLKQYGEIIVIYSENHRKHINMCCGRNASFVFLNISVRILTLRLLMSYIYIYIYMELLVKPEMLNVVYIWTYVWQR